MNRDPLLVRALLACYPPRWRCRYGDEFAELLTGTLAPARWYRRPALVVDVLRGALDARLHPGPGGPTRSRSPLSAAVWATALFVLAGIGFQKLTEDQGLAAAGQQHAALGWSFATVVVAAMVALAALAVTAVPAAVAIVRGRARGAVRPLAVPVLAVAGWYGLLRLVLVVAGHHRVHSAPNLAAAVLLAGAGAGVVAATAWAATAVLSRAGAPGPARLRTTATAVLAAGMAVTTLACLAWGLAVRAAAPAGFARHGGILATPFAPSWIGAVALMAAATALAATAARRQAAEGPARPA